MVTPPADSATRDEAPFEGYVVAVGASAGGLDALERLFAALPTDSGAAFVVVQHLSPDHKSMMDNLLARHTRMPVCVAEQGMALAADRVFLIPAGKTMQLVGSSLHLDPKPEHGLSLPIDIFFSSMAEQVLDRAIAVVLSGTGSDGSRGLVTVNANGGFVFVQEPKTARFDGMPRSAIATGLVDAVAPAEALAERLVRHIRLPRAALDVAAPLSAQAAAAEPLQTILDQLLASGGIDFHEYKANTVLRRVERRMQLLHTPTLAEYGRRLAASTEEQTLLRRELLIPVTRFFRDAEAFDALAQEVVPPLVVASPEPIRVWVACCATGEEAYSIAILFAEAFERAGRRRGVKIFATDVEQHYLDQAALGQYPETIAAELTPERLARWFTPRAGGYTVRPELRQMVIFARHNLAADPPFTRMDLVSCRNALIYLQAPAQDRALRRLQYALRVQGCLLLGPSESLGAAHGDFVTVRAREKLYRLARHGRAVQGAMAEVAGRHRPAHERRSGAAGAASVAAALAENNARWFDSGQRALMAQYAPPTLLVGGGRELLHVYGDASGWLQFTEGQATLDVLRLLPRELSWAASVLLQATWSPKAGEAAAAEHRSAPLALPQRGNAPADMVVLVARPLVAAGANEAEAGIRAPVLLSLEPAPGPVAQAVPLQPAQLEAGIVQQQLVERLEADLLRTRESLQATIEELEASNEELQATNEEMMASNEELQSTNEELQSVNEELYTVNSEYQEKVDLLNSVNADLENVSKAAAIPTLFVDDALRLTRVTPEAALLFKVRELDIGRSIEDFAHTLDYPELFSDLRRTVAGGPTLEREVKSRNGDWWLARLHPYAGPSAASSRAVMTFFNITSVKDSQRLQAIVDSLPEHLAVLDPQGQIVLVNQAWRRFAVAEGDADLRGCGPGRNYLRVCADAALADDSDAQRAYTGLRAVLAGQQEVFTMQYPCHSPQQQRWFLMHVAPVGHPVGGAVVSHIDITGWMLRQQAWSQGKPA